MHETGEYLRQNCQPFPSKIFRYAVLVLFQGHVNLKL